MVARLLVLLLVCVVVINAAKKPQETLHNLMLEHKQELCANLEKESWSFFRCVDNEDDLALPGKLFLQTHKVTELDPVILLPGIGGSALDAKLNKQDSPAWYCFKRLDWFRIWFATQELFVQTCWMDNLALSYDHHNKTYNNTYGVDMRPTDFGGLQGVEYLDYKLGIPIIFTSIYASLVKSLVAVGYVRGKNIRGAPFDWRLPAATLDERGWYDQLQKLIEETYTTNGNKPVHIVSHSLGCPTALYFLNKMPQSWLDKYIKSFVPIAGPWSGAGKALRAAVSGDNFGLSFAEIDIVGKKQMRNVARNAGGLVQLFPDNILWPADTVLVRTPTKNYTVHDYPELFADAGNPMTAIIWEDVNTLNEMKPPRVPTYCIYGYGVPTEISYYYNKGFDTDPIVDSSNLGDGTVPLESLQLCQLWNTQQPQPITVTEYNLIGHGDIIKNAQVIAQVLNITTR